MTKLPAEAKGFIALASGDPADRDAAPINSDVRVLAARMTAGEELVHALSPKRAGYLVPTHGAITVNGVDIAALDGCLVSDESALKITAEQATEIVFVELI